MIHLLINSGSVKQHFLIRRFLRKKHTSKTGFVLTLSVEKKVLFKNEGPTVPIISAN